MSPPLSKKWKEQLIQVAQKKIFTVQNKIFSHVTLTQNFFQRWKQINT